MVRYTNYTNLDACFLTPYQPGDRLVKGWTGEVDEFTVSDVAIVEVTLERIFTRHNRDDRPDGQLCPSMSIGDVVILSADDAIPAAWSVNDRGFVPVTVDPADLITDRTWSEAR